MCPVTIHLKFASSAERCMKTRCILFFRPIRPNHLHLPAKRNTHAQNALLALT